jgi:hypothetical protein
MAKNKIIFGAGKVPRASDFTLGELVINVTDQKVFSKDKTNTVFEIQGAVSTSTPSNIDTGSFYLSSSLNNNIITFNQGDGTTEQVDLSSIINASGDDDWFIDTSNSRLTSSLNVYVSGDITSSKLRLGSGTSNSPAIVFADNNTGIFSSAPGILNFQIDGSTTEFILQNTKATFNSPSFFVDGNITGSTNISASGYLEGHYIKLSDKTNPLPTPQEGIIIYSASNFYAGIE